MRERKTGKKIKTDDPICRGSLHIEDGKLVCPGCRMVVHNHITDLDWRPKCVDCKYRVAFNATLDNINLEEIEDEKDN